MILTCHRCSAILTFVPCRGRLIARCCGLLFESFDQLNSMSVFNEDRFFWEGFDAAIEMALNVVDNSDARKDDKEIIQDEIIESVELYKKDG